MNNAKHEKQRSKRPSQPKNRKNANMSKSNVSSSTTAGVQSALRARQIATNRPKKNRQLNVDFGYARCRLDPFRAGPSRGIPDMVATRKLVFDHRGAANITVNGDASVIIVPTLPWGALIKPDATGNIITINGVSINQDIATSGNVINWVPCCRYNDYVPTANIDQVPTIIADPVVSSRIRVVGVGFRLMPTSPATTIAGTVEIMDQELTLTTPKINSTAITVYNPSGVSSGTLGVGTIDILPVQLTTSERFQQLVPNTVVHRLESSPTGILKHSGPYVFGDVPNTPFIPIIDQNNANDNLTMITSDPLSATRFGSVWYWDPSFSTKRIKISTPSQQSFRLETMICVEYILSNSNPFARVAQVSPTPNPGTVAMVDHAIANMPAAVPDREMPGVFNKFLKAVSAGAPLAGAVFGPAGAAVGGAVAGLSEALTLLL